MLVSNLVVWYGAVINITVELKKGTTETACLTSKDRDVSVRRDDFHLVVSRSEDVSPRGSVEGVIVVALGALVVVEVLEEGPWRLISVYNL